MPISRANEKWLNPIFVDKKIRTIVDEETLWEKKLPHQTIDSMTYAYDQEQYLDIATPSDSARGRTLDPAGRKQTKRGEGGAYPKTGISSVLRKYLDLSEDALAIDYLEEEVKYPSKVIDIFRKQNKLARQFASGMNEYFGDALSASWAATPSTINYVAISSGNEWSGGYADSTVDAIGDILDAIEKIENISTHAYKANELLVNKTSHFDLLDIFVKKNYELKFNKPDSLQGQIPGLGLSYTVTQMVKEDYAMVADFKSCGIVVESSPLRIETLEDKSTHRFSTQIDRTYGFALTDPKAICTIVNVA